jgi:ribonuclease-3
MNQETSRFNYNNRVIKNEVVKEWIHKYGIEHDPSDEDMKIFRQSLIHRSYSTPSANRINNTCPEKCLPIQLKSNERLEFLGDSVLGLVVVSYLYERFPGQDEGFLTKMKTKLVNGISVSGYSRHLGIAKWLCLSKEKESDVGRDHRASLEDAFEAFLGALFIVCGFDKTRTWMINFMEKHIDFCDLIMQKRDYKDQLVKHFQAVHKCLPIFQKQPSKIGSNDIHISVMDKNGSIVSTARGTTTKEAESKASKNALKYYGFF